MGVSDATSPDASAGTATRRQIRGSSLLLAGRLLSRGVNFCVQIAIVRYLQKSDFGALAYGLSIVAVGETLVTFGLDRAVTRFVPIYHEQRDYARMGGTLVMVIGSMAALGTLFVLGMFGFELWFGDAVIGDAQTQSLLLLLVFLSPVQAIDTVLVGLFAVFSSPSAIFFRRYVLAPAFKIVVVAALLLGEYDVTFLAAGYVGAGALGAAISVALLLHMLRQQNLTYLLNVRRARVPWKPVLAFTVPLLSSDLMYAVMHLMDTAMLGYFRDTTAVADFRAVQPTAHLNQLVFASFGTLFTPLAARMFARQDRQGINHLYWQTAIWIAVLSFPIFALTFSLAEPVTVLLFGEEYRDSGLILAVLALGYYFNAALGMNGLTLKVYGRVGYVVVLNGITIVVTIVANLILIPLYGAMGAAVGTTATLVVHNILKQAGLRRTGVRLFEPATRRVYAVIGASAIALFALPLILDVPFPVQLSAAVLVSLLVVRLNRRQLDVEDTLPELLRLPFMRQLLGR